MKKIIFSLIALGCLLGFKAQASNTLMVAVFDGIKQTNVYSLVDDGFNSDYIVLPTPTKPVYKALDFPSQFNYFANNFSKKDVKILNSTEFKAWLISTNHSAENYYIKDINNLYAQNWYFTVINNLTSVSDTVYTKYLLFRQDFITAKPIYSINQRVDAVFVGKDYYQDEQLGITSDESYANIRDLINDPRFGLKDYISQNFADLNLENSNYKASTIQLSDIDIPRFFKVFNKDEIKKVENIKNDVRRLSDVKQISVALEMYYNDAGAYPISIKMGQPIKYNQTIYLSSVPSNPTPGGQDYKYTVCDGGQGYLIGYKLDQANGSLSAGGHLACISGSDCNSKEIAQICKVPAVPINKLIETSDKKSTTPVKQKSLAQQSAGKIFLQVESAGEAWYVAPKDLKRYYLKDGETAYQALRQFGVGITNDNLAKIPVGLNSKISGTDSDSDGIDDATENAMGTEFKKADSDGDSYPDGQEINSGFNPLSTKAMPIDNAFATKQEGKILLQVEGRGEAWYVYQGKRYYMADGPTAFKVMRFLSTGITNANLDKIDSGTIN